jgi:hypothetical protein
MFAGLQTDLGFVPVDAEPSPLAAHVTYRAGDRRR